jgi:hypothetical protein
LVGGGGFVLREKYCWLVADKPSEQGATPRASTVSPLTMPLGKKEKKLFYHPEPNNESMIPS